MVFPIPFSAFAFGALARLRWLLMLDLMYLLGRHGRFQGLCQDLHLVLGLQPFCHKVDELLGIQAGINPAALDNMIVKGVSCQAHHLGLCWGIRALDVEALGSGGTLSTVVLMAVSNSSLRAVGWMVGKLVIRTKNFPRPLLDSSMMILACQSGDNCFRMSFYSS